MTKLFFHIGFAKTGTTFLQQMVFPNLKDINYCGKYYGINQTEIDKSNRVKNFIHKILTLHHEDFDAQKTSLKKEIYGLNLNENEINLISNEAIISGQITGNYKDASIERTINRIKILFNDNYEIYIFFVIRNHSDLIFSSINGFKDRFLINYDKDIDIELDKLFRNKKSFIFEKFKFFELNKKIQKIIGNKNVKFFLFEDIFKGDNTFLKELQKFLCINKKIDLQINFKKKINATREKKRKIPKLQVIFKNKKILNNLKNLSKILLYKKYSYKKDFIGKEKLIKRYYSDDLKQFSDQSLKSKLRFYKYF